MILGSTVGFAGLYISWGVIIPAVLQDSLVIVGSVLTYEVLLKIQIASTHTIDIVCHTFWDFQEAIFLANIPLDKAIVANWAKTYLHILHTCFCIFSSFPYMTRSGQCWEPNHLKYGNLQWLE
jgi:hypothetical protein